MFPIKFALNINHPDILFICHINYLFHMSRSWFFSTRFERILIQTEFTGVIGQTWMKNNNFTAIKRCQVYQRGRTLAINAVLEKMALVVAGQPGLDKSPSGC